MNAENPDDIPRIKVPPKAPPQQPPPQQPPRAPSDESRTVRISEQPDDTPYPPPQSDYTILRKIGDGGMGVVYLAKDHKLDRYVAIKRLKPRVLSRPALKKRFFREAKAIAALSHMNIVHVYALSEDVDGPYIVMEYVAGPRAKTSEVPPPPFTLGDLILQDGPMPLDKALVLISKLSMAVEYAHGRGVIHRDIKPSNVLLNESGEPKIVDFGLARKLTTEEDQLTVPGEKMLSLGYGAPEQESGEPDIDRRADVYGLGALLYFALTGQNPRYFRPSHVPDAIRAALVKALETDRNKRWTGAREFVEALHALRPSTAGDLPTAKATWRCKWCDTVNPLSIKYCGDCGWDGSEICAECGADTRAGILFCGNCGANARDYEMASVLLARLKRQAEAKQFELLVQYAGQISGFQPSGPTGRNIAEQANQILQNAEKALARLKELRQKIPQAVQEKHFDFARSLIEEYMTLSGDNAFAVERKNLPDLALRQNIERVREAIRNREWRYARRAARGILVGPAPDNVEVRKLLLTARWCPWWLAFRNVVVATVILFLVYLFSAAPIYRFRGRTQEGRYRSFFALATLIRDETFMRSPLTFHAWMWGVRDLYESSTPQRMKIESIIPSASGKHNKLAIMESTFKRAILKLDADYARREREWPVEYTKALKDLQQQFQKDGNFDGWESVRIELSRFETYPDIPEEAIVDGPREIRGLQEKHRGLLARKSLERHQKIAALARKQLQELEALQKSFTKQNQMDSAAQVSTAIRQAKSMPEVVAAEAAVAPKPPPSAPRPAPPSAAPGR